MHVLRILYIDKKNYMQKGIVPRFKIPILSVNSVAMNIVW